MYCGVEESHIEEVIQISRVAKIFGNREIHCNILIKILILYTSASS